MIDPRVNDPWIEEPKGPILSLADLTVSFDGFKALDGLTIEVDRGELRPTARAKRP
jgi:urea transport system ATP-binding protein